jgi:inhibitor of KinA sporulation pathway (predicted exonuclease)
LNQTSKNFVSLDIIKTQASFNDDFNNLKAVDTCQYFVKPEAHPHKLDYLSVECQNLTQFNESLIENACGLEEAIYEVSAFFF